MKTAARGPTTRQIQKLPNLKLISINLNLKCSSVMRDALFDVGGRCFGAGVQGLGGDVAAFLGVIHVVRSDVGV